MHRVILITFASLSLLLAGCIELPQDSLEQADADGDAATPQAHAGSMTAREGEPEEGATLCLDGGISVPGFEPFCAERRWQVAGELDMATFVATLRLTAADIEIVEAPEGKWSLDFYVTARGETAERAADNLDEPIISWEHEQAGGHFLDLGVAWPEGIQIRHANVEIVLALPAGPDYGFHSDSGSGDLTMTSFKAGILDIELGSGDVLLRDVEARSLSVDTGSGDIDLEAVRAETIRLDSGSGDQTIDVIAGSLTSSAGSGDLDGAFTPAGVGQVTIERGSGDVDLQLLEGSSFGYDIVAQAGSGDVSIGLKDGRLAQDDDHAATFRTSDFASRADRVTMGIDTGSGDINLHADVAPPTPLVP